jgi:hypothetical protein
MRSTTRYDSKNAGRQKPEKLLKQQEKREFHPYGATAS